MIYLDAQPLTIFGRLLTCTKCAAHVDLIELPWPWIDGTAYVCGECLPVANTERRENEVAAARGRWTDYDPKTSPWPAGF